MLTVWAPTQALPLCGFGHVAFSLSPGFLIFETEVLVSTFLGYGGRSKGVSIGKVFSTGPGRVSAQSTLTPFPPICPLPEARAYIQFDPLSHLVLGKV